MLTLWIDVICNHHGPLARYVKLQVAHVPGMPGAFSPPSLVSDSDMYRGTCVTQVPWCMTGLLTSGFLRSRWRGKRSQCMSGKRLMKRVSLCPGVMSAFESSYWSPDVINVSGYYGTSRELCELCVLMINISWDIDDGFLHGSLMKTSSNGTIFRVTGHLCGEFTDPRWIPRTKASDAELWCFLSFASE